MLIARGSLNCIKVWENFLRSEFAARHWWNFSLNVSSIFRCQNQRVWNCLSSRICWCAWLNGSIPFYLCSVTRIIGVLVQVLALILHSACSSNRKNDFVHSNRNIICVRLWCSVNLYDWISVKYARLFFCTVKDWIKRLATNRNN